MIQFALSDLYLVMMAFTRVGALFLMLPVFSSSVFPIQARIGLIGITAVMLLPTLELNGALPTHVVGLVIAMSGEILIGMLMGFAARLVFFAVEFATDIIAQQAALMSSRTFDPTREIQTSTMGPLYYYLTVIVFYATGTHLEVMAAFVHSYSYVPAGVGLFSFGGIEQIVRVSGGVFTLGLKMGAPILALAFVMNFVFAILGRVAPKVNVLVLSFGARILLAFLLLYLSGELMVQYILLGIDGTALRMIELIIP